MKKYLRLGGIFALGLGVGLLVGVKLNRCRMMPGELPAEFFLRTFSQELSLTTTQKKQIREIFHGARGKLRSFMMRVGPEFREIRAEVKKEIVAILEPEQIKKFEEIHQRLERRFEKLPFPPRPPEESE